MKTHAMAGVCAIPLCDKKWSQGDGGTDTLDKVSCLDCLAKMDQNHPKVKELITALTPKLEPIYLYDRVHHDCEMPDCMNNAIITTCKELKDGYVECCKEHAVEFLKTAIATSVLF